MATASTSSAESSSAPLADYFFIAGIDSPIFEPPRATNGTTTSLRLESTIEESTASDSANNNNRRNSRTNPSPRPGSRDAAKRISRFSWDKRQSVGSLSGIEDGKATASNRSSATIRAVPQENGNGLTDLDFENALKKFAADRDSVLAEIQFSAGQVAQPSKPAPKPRTMVHRLQDESDGQGLKSGIGSVRRRISTMNPLSRQNTSRRTSARMSRRLSGYNSVIPAPQRFAIDANMHPLKRPYEPVLLDQYPSKDMDETKRRSPFPDYVPMFVFPNDVNVVSSDERPRSTWHGFAMTTQDGSRLYGITLIMWIPLKHDDAEELERQCETWRRANMTDEERELANSLGERLAGERAHLSELLSQLPQYASDTAEREAKEEEISAVEEKIGLMTDMLRPVRHGASSRIEGLTDGETGLWMPRAYGVLGRDSSLTSFWKEWLRAIVTPMTSGSILRVPASSPRIGVWQPVERYVVNLCAEALSPITSKTQVELAIRELRMYARKEAINEIPGSRNTDLYPLFRSLDIPAIVTLFEFVLSESRIILLSSHTSMLHLASAAIVQLLYPLKWAAVFIPVLPARLIQALEAPCPYIVGIERRYENVDLPEDDIVLVDLDHGTIEATGPPLALPRQQRRKLVSILQLAAPHRYRFGVPVGPPKYATESFPNDAFPSENPGVFDPTAAPSRLAHLANLNSAAFGEASTATKRPPLFNAFHSSRISSHGSDRPSTSATTRETNSPTASPLSANFPPMRNAPASRNDSSFSIQTTLREKRSGIFESARRNSTVYISPSEPIPSFRRSRSEANILQFGLDRVNTGRRPSAPFAGAGHGSMPSISTMNTDFTAPSTYAPSVYAQSTLAASTIMPHVLMQPVHNNDTTQWVEGHCLRWTTQAGKTKCSVCDDKADEGVFRCTGCGISVHSRCTAAICLVCPVAFHPDQIMAAFVRCFASLFYTYRKHMVAAPRGNKGGTIYKFNSDAFLKSLPSDQASYMQMLRETQAFSEFIGERETRKSDDPSIRLFDEIILSKRNRGRASLFSKSQTSFLSDTSDHLWRSAAATVLTSSNRAPPSSQHTVGRIPAKLDKALLKEPRVFQGMPRVTQGSNKPRRKMVPSMLAQDLTASEPSSAASETSSASGPL